MGVAMPWEEEQDKLTREARLFLSSPEIVFAELKKLSEQARAHFGAHFALTTEKLEPSLLERNDRLINLGLAQYGTHIDVFKALYKHGLENSGEFDEKVYRRGLRVACL